MLGQEPEESLGSIDGDDLRSETVSSVLGPAALTSVAATVAAI